MKGKLIALCGISGALVALCLMLTSWVPFVSFILAVMCSTAVSVPLLANGNNLPYSVLTALVGSVVGVLLGANFVYASVIVAFALPVAIVKASTNNKVLRYVLYYVFCQVALALALVSTSYVMPQVWQKVTSTGIIYIIVVIAQLAVPVYDVVLNVCFNMARKALIKSHFDE